MDTSKGIRDIKGTDWKFRSIGANYPPHIGGHGRGDREGGRDLPDRVLHTPNAGPDICSALPVPEAPPVPPHLVALQALEELGKN